MKRKINFILTLVVMLTTATAWAQNVGNTSGTCGTGVNYTYTESTHTLTISGTGAMTDFASDNDQPWSNYRTAITTLVIEEGVTRIGNNSFRRVDYVTNVTLPASVTSIGVRAFQYTGRYAEGGCSFSAAKNSQLTSIEANAFTNPGCDVDLRNCTKLTAINNENVFYNFTKTVTFPRSLTSVCANAFKKGSKMPTVKLSYKGFLVINGEYQSYNANGAVRTITSKFGITTSGSKAVTICQGSIDGLTWNTDGNYFEINDEQDLIDLGNYVSSGSTNNCKGLTFKMTADLDFTNMPDDCHNKKGLGSGNFLPIGIDAARGGTTFSGHFVGDGHSITGLRFSYYYNEIGLFCSIYDANTVIEGVTLVNPNFSAYQDVGGIAGFMRVGTIRNCAVVGGTISANNYAGGIVGSSIYNLHNYTNVKSIEDCTVVGTTVSSTEYVGIIVGFNTTQTEATAALTIKDCTYYTPAGLDICGYGDGDRYTDGGGNQQVYQITLDEGFTASGATYSHDLVTDKAYYTNGSTVTLAFTPKSSKILRSVTATSATSGNKISLTATGTNTYTFTMPQEDVNISAAWKKLLSNTDISINAIDDQEWTGKAIEPTIVVKDGATDITDQCDFAFSDNTNTGYSGSTSTTFKITQKNIGQWGALAVTQDQNGKTATFDGTSTTEVNIPAMAGLTANIVKYNRTFTPGKASTVMLPFEYEITGNEGGEFYAFAGVEKEGENWVATMKPDNNQLTNKQTLTANKPYLFLPTATSITFTIPNGGVSLCTEGGGNCQTTDAGSQWEFKGTYQPHYWYDGTDGVHAAENADEIGKVYGFAGNAKGDIKAGDFVKAKNGAKIRPMSCYLLWTGKSENNARSRRVAASATEQLPQSISVRLINASGETTGIGTLDTTTGDITFDGWYTLDGTRLDSKPAKSGIYINNGKKVIIK